MKWMSTILGSLFVFIGVVLSPWPQFILDFANNILAMPEAAGDVMFHTMVKGAAMVVAYILFPIFGGIFGYVIGYILVRRLD